MASFDLDTLTFGEPFYLWLLVAPGMLAVFWVWRVFRRRAEIRSFTREHVAPASNRYPFFGDLMFWLCAIVAASLCIGALARPRALVTGVRRTGADIVLLQDGSASMYVRDVKPDRWRRSVQFLRAFAETMSWKNGDRAALALFAHLAAPQVRLTKDPNALFFFLDHLGQQSLFRLEDDPTWNTNIEAGVHWGLQLLDTDEQLFGKSKNPKALVVISDGQAWSGEVEFAILAARERGVVVHVVGIGTVRGGMIPEPVQPDVATAASAPIRGVLDRESLRAIADAGGGEYFEIGLEPDRDIARRIIAEVKRRAPATQIDQYEDELYGRLLFAAALVLCLGAFTLKTSSELWLQVAGAIFALGVLALAI